MTTAELQRLQAELSAERQRSARLTEQVHQLMAELERARGAMHEASSSQLLTEEALDDTRSRLTLAMEAAQLGLWEWSVEQGHVYVDAQWSTLMGDVAMEADYAIHDLLRRIHPDDLPGVNVHLNAVTAGMETRYRIQFRMLNFQQEWLWMESHGMGVDFDALGRPRRLLGVSADISDRKQLEVATERARQEAEAANRSKSEFLANVSHEVRTPLNGLMGLTRLLMDSPLTDQQRHWLQLMDESGQTLLTILNDVLDLSKVEAGRMEVERIPFDLNAALEQALAPFGVQADTKQVQLASEPDLPHPHEVIGDPVRLKQVLTNLLSNALKFTPSGGRVDLRASVVSPSQVLFEVQDSGIGIAPEHQHKIFQAFTQADASTTRKYGGTGLGLAISARLVDLMGGTLRVESEPGLGSRFFFELPLPATSTRSTHGPLSAPMELEHLTSEQGHFDGLKVLVAEDHPINELLMRELLNKLGCAVTVARNGLEAIARWKQGGIDFILMDVQMPELNGLDATAEIRALERSGWHPPQASGTHTPIVAVTANAMSDDAALCLAAGMDAYTSKPVSPQALTQAMAKALALAKARNERPRTPPPPAESSRAAATTGQPRMPAPPPMDLDTLRHRLGSNGDELHRVAQTASGQLTQHLKGMESALNDRQSSTASQHAHALKLALARLTADRAAALCNGLETAARKEEWTLFQRALPVLRTELQRVQTQLEGL